MRREAAQRRLSLSRYTKERLAPVRDDGDDAIAIEQQLIAGLRKMVMDRTEGLAENLRTVMVMLDQLVRSTLTHLPEIPSAELTERLSVGERRHRDWQHQVEDLLRQLRGETARERHVRPAMERAPDLVRKPGDDVID
jgi:hypothetical protein